MRDAARAAVDRLLKARGFAADEGFGECALVIVDGLVFENSVMGRRADVRGIIGAFVRGYGLSSAEGGKLGE